MGWGHGHGALRHSYECPLGYGAALRGEKYKVKPRKPKKIKRKCGRQRSIVIVVTKMFNYFEILTKIKLIGKMVLEIFFQKIVLQ